MARTFEAFTNYFSNVILPTHPNPEYFTLWLNSLQTLETQLLVTPVGGYPVEGKHNVFTDGSEEWHSIRWPKQAASEPYYTDPELTFLLEKRWQGLGTTWWDWVNRESVAVGFDFDEITQHAPGTGITESQLNEVRECACALDYVDVIRSTGGKGLHLLVFFDEKHRPKTVNHTEHAALARSLLGKISTDAGFDFGSHLDVCGGVLWIAHQKMSTEAGSFQWLKRATTHLTTVPPNWKDHLDVVGGRTTKVRVVGIGENGGEIDDQDPLAALTSARTRTPLDDVHRAIITDLEQSGGVCVWQPDHHLLQTHTVAVKQVYDKWTEAGHPMHGFFETLSGGSDLSKPNCFMIPSCNGAFQVFRFGQGTPEHALWDQDSQRWTRCFLNKAPTLSEASIALGGIEAEGNKGFIFDSAEKAEQAVKAIGSQLTLPEGNKYSNRPATLKRNKDGRLVVELAKWEGDEGFSDWLDKKNSWVKIFNINVDISQQEDDYTQFDTVVRSIRTPSNADAGWMIKVNTGEWIRHPQENVKHVLKLIAPPGTDISNAMGYAIMRQWTMVNLPFHEEYPGGRQWNLGAAQLKYKPATLGDEKPYHPHWDLVLEHCGEDLDTVIKDLEWCQNWGIFSGKDYLTAWIACMIREPFEPLPYLFMHGPQNSGKSIFHEAISLLVTGGVVKADRALTNQNDFNGELANAVLGVVDEVNISRAGAAVYNKIKEWTTSRYISIHPKRVQVYQQRNCLHFVQMANHRDNCPIFPGDTRITMMYVPPLLQEIPKPALLKALEDEAPHFMATLLGLPMPSSNSRLRLPVLDTTGKTLAAESNKTDLEEFLTDVCYEIPGQRILFKDFYNKFLDTLSPAEQINWPKRRIRQMLPEDFPMGRGNGGNIFIGNLSFDQAEPCGRYILQDQTLILEGEA